MQYLLSLTCSYTYCYYISISILEQRSIEDYVIGSTCYVYYAFSRTAKNRIFSSYSTYQLATSVYKILRKCIHTLTARQIDSSTQVDGKTSHCCGNMKQSKLVRTQSMDNECERERERERERVVLNSELLQSVRTYVHTQVCQYYISQVKTGLNFVYTSTQQLLLEKNKESARSRPAQKRLHMLTYAYVYIQTVLVIRRKALKQCSENMVAPERQIDRQTDRQTDKHLSLIHI